MIWWNFDLPLYHEVKLLLKQDSFNVSFKFLCLYYHHIAPIMKFLRKIKTLLEIHLKIWPAPRIKSWNFCENIEVLIMSVEKLSLLSATMFQFSEADLDLSHLMWSSLWKKWMTFSRFRWSHLKILTASKTSTSNLV